MAYSLSHIVSALQQLPVPKAGAVVLHGQCEALAFSALVVPEDGVGGRAVSEWRGVLAAKGLRLHGEPMVFASAAGVSIQGATRHSLPWGTLLLSVEAPRQHEALYPEQTLAVVRRTTEAAVISLTRQLKALTDSSKEQCQSLDRVVSHFVVQQDAPEALVGSLHTLEAGAGQAHHRLESRLLEHAARVKGAAQQASTVVRLAKTIDSVAQAVRLVTVNAQIESARLGAAGKGFGIIAQQMRELSSQVHEANQAVTGVALELAEVLPALTTSAGELARDAGADFNDLGQRLHRLRENFNAAQVTVLQSLEQSQRAAVDVQSRCELVSQELQFEDRVNQLLQHAQQQVVRLEQLLGVTESAAGDVFERAGQVGRALGGNAATAPLGSVQLF